MFIWRMLVELFTNLDDFGLPHIPLFIILFLALAAVEFLALSKGKKFVKFLPVIVTFALSMLFEISIWIFAQSYVSLLLVVILTYAVVATLGAIFGIIVYLIYHVYLKYKVRK